MKSLNLTRHELYLGRKNLLTWTLIIAGLMIMFVSTTTLIIDNAEMAELIEGFPQALLDSFNINVESFTTFEGWMASEPYVFFVLLLASFAIALASTSISREIDQGTGEFLFVTPHSRRNIFWSKAGADFLQISFVFLIGTAVTFAVGSTIVSITNPTGLFLVFLSAYLTALATAGIGYVLSCLIDNQRTALALGVGFVLLSFLFKSLAGMGGILSNLAKLSIFQLFDLFAILDNHALSFSSLATSLGIYIIGLVVGSEILARKNLNL